MDVKPSYQSLSYELGDRNIRKSDPIFGIIAQKAKMSTQNVYTLGLFKKYSSQIRETDVKLSYQSLSYELGGQKIRKNGPIFGIVAKKVKISTKSSLLIGNIFGLFKKHLSQIRGRDVRPLYQSLCYKLGED